MHRHHLAVLLIFLLNFDTIFGGKCEIVRFVNEKNIARKCCVLSEKTTDRNIADLKKQGFLVLQDGQTTSICRNIEKENADGSSVATKSKNGEKIEKNIPKMGVHQFVDSSSRCPDGTVFDFQGNCVSPFE